MIKRIFHSVVLAGCIAGLVSGCTGKQQPSGDGMAAQQEAPAEAKEGASVTSVKFGRYVGADFKVGGFQKAFATDEAVFGVVRLSGNAAKVEVSFRVVDASGKEVKAEQRSVAINGGRDANFVIAKKVADSLVPGDYVAHVALDGNESGITADFTVKP